MNPAMKKDKTIELIQSKSLEELEEYIQSKHTSNSYYKFAADLYQRKLLHLQREELHRQSEELGKLSKPHWTIIPNFWITLIAALAAILAAVATLITLFRSAGS